MLTVEPATFDGKRTIPSPRITEIMLELLNLEPSDRLLEIGTGSGYQTRRFADTGCEVFSVELEPWIDTTIPIGDYVFLFSGDGQQGLPEHGPYTAIVATCGVEELPGGWRNQLCDNGRLLVPIGTPECQKLTLFRKQNGELVPERVGAYTKFQMLRKPPKPGKVKYRSVE